MRKIKKFHPETRQATAFIALPVTDEPDLPLFFESLLKQDYESIEIFVCVNQRQSDWIQKKPICETNRQTWNYLLQIKESKPKCKIHPVDKASQEACFPDKKSGVGWARKVLMDAIAAVAQANDVIISADADTFYPSHYVSSLMKVFYKNPSAMGLANPYYHRLPENEPQARAALIYEIYMRAYAINLLRTRHPFAYTPIGSSMACPVWAYKKVGGLTPHPSGEDFYFLQKLAKCGKIITESEAMSYPLGRVSDRVFFGTGPAIAKGIENQWKSYPIYPYRLFDDVKKSYQALPTAFEKGLDSFFEKLRKSRKRRAFPLDKFLVSKFGDQWWKPLEENSRVSELFLTLCFQKIDALRTLQYLKSKYKQNDRTDNKNLLTLLSFYQEKMKFDLPQNFELHGSEIEKLKIVRDLLVEIEYTFYQTNTSC